MAGAFQSDAFQPNAFQVDAGGATTQTGSLTLDARIGYWFPVSAILRKTQTGSFTVGAVIRVTQVASFTTDAVIMPRFTLDAIAFKTMEATGVPVSISWDVWFSHSQVAVFKHEILLLRRDNLSGELLATSDPQGSGGDGGDSGSGYQWHAVGSFVDEAPTTGKYVLSVLKINGASDFYVGARTFAATGIDTDSFTSSTVTYVVYSGETLIPGCSVQVQSSRQAIRIRAALKAERTGSFSIAALLVPKKFLVDATIKATQQRSFTINSVFGQVFFVDAFIQPFFRVDAIKRRVGAGSLSVDAVIRPRFSIDAFVQPYFRVNAVQKATETASFSIDAFHVPFFYINAYIHPYFFIGAEISLAFKIDAVILATVGPTQKALTFPGASVTRLGQTANVLSPAIPIEAGTPAVVVVVNPPSDGGDLRFVSSTGSVGITVPSTPGEHFILPPAGVYNIVSSKGNVYRPFLMGLGSYKDWGVSTLHFSIDAYVSPTFRIDANFVWTFAFDFKLDAFKQIRVISSFPISAWVQPFFRIDARIVPRHFHLDAWIKCEFTVSAWIIRKVSGAFTIGAFLRPFLTIDAAIVRRQSGSFEVSSWFVNPRYGSFSADAFVHPYFRVSAAIQLTKYRTFSVAAWKILRPVSSFSIGAFVKPTFSVNAVLLKANSPGLFEIAVDAYIAHLIYGTFGVEAFIEGTIPINATFLRTFPSSTKLDAAVVIRPTASFTLNASITGFQIDAVLRSTQIAFFSLFAIKGGIRGAGSFTIDAERRDPGAYWDPITETWLHLHFLVDAITSIHPVGTFKVAAAIILPGQPIISWFIDAQITTIVRSSFPLESEISTEHTVVFEGWDTVGETVLRHVSQRLTWPGENLPGNPVVGSDNVLFGPFRTPEYQPVVLTVWDPPSTEGAAIGVASTDDNNWVKVVEREQGGFTNMVYGEKATTATFWPAYPDEDHYVYVWSPLGAYQPYQTGDAMVVYSRYDDVILSRPAPTIDAWIVGTIGDPFTIDAEIVELEKRSACTLDAEIAAFGEKRGSWLLDASIRGAGGAFFFLFANIAPRRFTLDAVVWQPSATIDAFIQPFLTLDAYFVPVKTTSTGTFTIKAWSSYLTSMSQMHIDAEIVSIGDMRDGVSVDAVLITERVSRFYLAAAFCLPPAGFTLDARIAPWFGIDAWIAPVGGGLGVVTVDAYIRGSSFIIFPDDGGAPTDPLGNPPALSREFSIRIEAGIPRPIPVGNDAEIERLITLILEAEAELDSLYCAVENFTPQGYTAVKGSSPNPSGGGYNRGSSLPGAISQIGYPNAGDIDDCWLVATVWAAVASGQSYRPDATTYRRAAMNPDRPGPTGGTADQTFRGAKGCWPGANIRRYASTDWNGFTSLLKAGWVASLAVNSGALPGYLQYGFYGLHQIGVAYQNGQYYVDNPLMSNGTSPVSIDEISLRTAARGFSGGVICATMFG